jgi:hypothetical protein
LKNAWDRIWAKFFKSGADVEQTDETRAKNPRFPEFEWHLDLQRMKKQLNAKIPNISEDSGTPEAFIHLSLMKAIHRYASLDEEGFREVIQGLEFENLLHLAVNDIINQLSTDTIVSYKSCVL